jgi:hypothetical protein
VIRIAGSLHGEMAYRSKATKTTGGTKKNTTKKKFVLVFLVLFESS